MNVASNDVGSSYDNRSTCSGESGDNDYYRSDDEEGDDDDDDEIFFDCEDDDDDESYDDDDSSTSYGCDDISDCTSYTDGEIDLEFDEVISQEEIDDINISPSKVPLCRFYPVKDDIDTDITNLAIRDINCENETDEMEDDVIEQNQNVNRTLFSSATTSSCDLDEDEVEIETVDDSNSNAPHLESDTTESRSPTKSPVKKKHCRGKSGTGSIIHEQLEKKKVVFVSFDIETGGPYCGIIQLSAVFVDQDDQELGHFDSYCRPPSNAVFQPQACECHGMTHRHHKNLKDAPKIDDVWKDFCLKVKSIFERPEQKDAVGVFVAYNGKSCDMDWIFKLVYSAEESTRELPPEIQYFMDPYHIIRSMSGCKLHPKKSGLTDLKLTTVYRYIDIEHKDYENAHNSLADCYAQRKLLMSDQFKDYWNKTNSVCTLESIWSKKRERHLQLKEELDADVPNTWRADDNAESWTIPESKQFNSASGGATPGPTSRVRDCIREATNAFEALSNLFLFFFSWRLLEYIAFESNRYAYDDFVIEKKMKDDEGNYKKKKILVPCPNNSPSPLKRNRVRKGKSDSWEFTAGSVLAWIGICIMWGAYGSKRSTDIMWASLLNGGLYLPMVRNAMSKNCFRFVRQYIHFENNASAANHDEDPLYKIRKIITKLSDSLKLGWNANIALSVDESMIKYKGRSIKFVQYMPKKPIKHGIKVFCLCDAETGYLLAFEVYTGENCGSTWDIISRLIEQAGIGNETGRRLFMDNYYTTMKVVTSLYENYGWVCAGTVVLTKKKAEKRGEDDFPFSKISNPATNMVKRGWTRRATKNIKPSNNKHNCGSYKVQATVWKDKRIVGWLHTDCVKPGTVEVKRKMKGKQGAVKFKAPPVQKEYSTKFNGVDLNDKDSAKYSTSLRSNRWHLRIFFWMLDRIVHACFVIVFAIASEVFMKKWIIYKSKNNGRSKFQHHLGIACINAGIMRDWKKTNGKYEEKNKPKWMPQTAKNGKYHPCDCGICFFCMNGFTQDITHGTPTRTPKECNGKRETLSSPGWCDYCKDELKKAYPLKKKSELRKLKDENSGKRLWKQPIKGCSVCKKRICEPHFYLHSCNTS